VGPRRRKSLTPPSVRLPTPEIRRRRHISPVWAIPIVAALVAVWLAYTTLAGQGPRITITFATAEGLEAGKTPIKHNNVQLGVVDTVELSPDLSHVVVSAKMRKAAVPHLAQGTRFWVVRPRLSLTSLSGLETLVSGAHIEMDPDSGAYAENFHGLELPPVVRAGVPGREFLLMTPKRGALGPGSPILFRGIEVGEVLGYDFGGADKDITVHAFLRSPYDALVRDGTRFWNASGIRLATGAQGFKLEIESLQAVLSGGIAFETPEAAQAGEPSREGALFTLYDDHESVRDASYTQQSRYLVEFVGSVHGLEPGAPVEFKGVQVGRVVDVHLEFDPTSNAVHVPVLIELERQRVQQAPGAPIPPGSTLTAELVSRGMRAQLRTSSLITGQLYVALDFFPHAPSAELDTSGRYPAIPTVPGEIEGIATSLGGVLERVGALPLDQLVADLDTTIKSYGRVAEMPELRDSLRSLSRTLLATESLMHSADGQAGPLLASLLKTSDAAQEALRRADTTLASVNQGYGSDSQIRQDIAGLLRQLQDTARSVKMLADSLEQHPESLVRGK
jgi:paraquat-inducible protein B